MKMRIAFYTNNKGLRRSLDFADSLGADIFYSSIKSKKNIFLRLLTYPIYVLFDALKIIKANSIGFYIFEFGGKSDFITAEYFLFFTIIAIKRKHFALDIHAKGAKTYLKKTNNYIWKNLFKNAKFLILHNEDSIMDFTNFKTCLVESKIPMIKKKEVVKGYKINVVFITTFQEDEPIVEMLEATKDFDESYLFYFTGNYKNYFETTPIEDNVIFTSFLPRQDYLKILNNSDVIVVLTKREKTLVYGGREALALEKPLVVSSTITNKRYYKNSAIYCSNEPASIANSIIRALNEKETLQQSGIKLIKEKEICFKNQIVMVRELINN